LHRCGAKSTAPSSWSLRLLWCNLPCWPYHITCPHCKTKLDDSTFLLHVLRGF
jgi:hypothetical protein